MAKISASEKKRIIARLKRRKLSPADLIRRGQLNRTLVPSGRLDAARLMFERRLGIMKRGETAKHEQHELQRFRDKQMAAAKKAFAAIKDPFRYGIKERIKTLKRLSTFPRPAEIDNVILDTPILIWAYPYDSILDDAGIQPSDSWAKFKFTVSGAEQQSTDFKVVFFYLWQNDYGRDVMINAETFITSSGFVESVVNPRGIIVGGWSTMDIDVGLDILELWNNPNTSPVFEEDQFFDFPEIKAEVLIDLGIPIILDEISSAFIKRLDNPKHNGFFTVPRNGSVLFEPFIAFSIDQSKMEILGDIQTIESVADFESIPAFSVRCPFVHLEVVVPQVMT